MSCDGRRMTSTDALLPPVPVALRWRWRRLRLATIAVRVMLIVQFFAAFRHYVEVPDRIVTLAKIHEPIRFLRIPRIEHVLHELNRQRPSWLRITITTAAAFGLWLWAAYSVLDRPGDERCFRRVWALVAWFIPFANLYVPKQILNDIVVAQERHDERAASARFVRNWVTAWWACWVTMALGTSWALWMQHGSITVAEAQNAELLRAVCDTAVLVTSVVATVAVRELTCGQRELLVDDVPRFAE